MTEVIKEDRVNESKVMYVTKDQYEKMKSLGVPMDNVEIKDKLEEARKKKLESLEERAKDHVQDLMNLFHLFDPLTTMYKLQGLARQSVFWHYRSRQMAERLQAKLDAQGSTESPLDTRVTGLEIDPIGSDWDRISELYARADAEQIIYLACIYAQNQLYRENKSDPDLVDRMRGAAIDEAITETGYSRWCQKQDQEYLNRRRSQEATSRQTAAVDYATKNWL